MYYERERVNDAYFVSTELGVSTAGFAKSTAMLSKYLYSTRIGYNICAWCLYCKYICDSAKCVEVNRLCVLSMNSTLTNFGFLSHLPGNSEEHTALSRALSQLAEVEEKIEQLHLEQVWIYLLSQHTFVHMVSVSGNL